MAPNKRKPLLSYHNKPEIKNEYLARVRAHRKADLLAQGETGNPGIGQKGCAVACTMNGYDHYRYGPQIGVSPAWAFLEDAIFEGLSVEDSAKWPEQFLRAVPVGVDLWPAYHRVTKRILLEVALPGIPKSEPKESRDRIEAAIRTCAGLYEEAAQMKIVSPTFAYWKAYGESAAWSAAESAAESAAWFAARSAAWAAARFAAESAARFAARSAAEFAARSAARSAAESAARSAAESAARFAAESAAESAARFAAESAAYSRIAKIVLQELRKAGK